jgi:hypothetical protein
VNISSATALVLSLVTAPTTAVPAWAAAYDKALIASDVRDWEQARALFQKADSNRRGDSEKPSNVGGEEWRGGAPYSPRFAGSYAGYRLALETADSGARIELLKQVDNELNSQLRTGHESAEAVGVLRQVQTLRRNTVGLADTNKKLQGSKLDWTVDTDFMLPEDRGLAAAVRTDAAGSEGAPAGLLSAGDPRISGPLSTRNTGSTVEKRRTKFALLIGNSEGGIARDRLPFAAADATMMQEALTLSAGYDPANIELVVNSTSSEILKAAESLSNRMPKEATLLIFFAGSGVQIGGQDWLVGADTVDPSDPSTMLSKRDLLSVFSAKSPQMFLFFEAGRKMDRGRCFGQEIPESGATSQMMGTLPGATALGSVGAEQAHGLFALAMKRVLSDLQSNEVPIMEFGWLVFNAMRSGSNDAAVGRRVQTPTLPVLNFMARDARF